MPHEEAVRDLLLEGGHEFDIADVATCLVHPHVANSTYARDTQHVARQHVARLLHRTWHVSTSHVARGRSFTPPATPTS